jgi:L-alanine-DL-glutamate epimerase-like enolase superfamily enzyme
MKIKSVKAAIVEGNFDWMLIRIDTDEGLTGFGECYSSHYSAEIKQFVSTLSKELLGQSPYNIARLTHKMSLGNTSGYGVNAISGIEMALWDLVGKALDQPIHVLLGGSHRDEVKIYADCHAGESISSLETYGGDYESYTPEAYAKNAKNIERKGYSLLKFDFYPGFPGPGNKKIVSPLSKADLKHCAEIVACVRGSIKDETGLALDLGGGYTVTDAIRLGKIFEPFNLEWMEDPVPGNNIDAFAQVTNNTSTPVMCSYTQLRNTRQLCRELIVKQAARILAIDFGNIGGLQEGRKITDLAELYFIPIATHNIASPVGTIAAAQVSSTMPNFVACENHSLAVPWWENLIKEKQVIQKGYYKLNQKPGLGIELDEKEVVKHLKEGDNFF